MAATTINIGFVDNKGKTSKTEIRVPSTFTIAQYREFALAAAQLILAISSGRITGISVNFGMDFSTWGLDTVANTVGSIRTKIAGFFQTASGILAKWFIPDPLETKVIDGSDDFDQSDTAVAALISANEDGIAVTGGTFQPTNGRGDDITGVSAVKEQFRARKP